MVLEMFRVFVSDAVPIGSIGSAADSAAQCVVSIWLSQGYPVWAGYVTLENEKHD